MRSLSAILPAMRVYECFSYLRIWKKKILKASFGLFIFSSVLQFLHQFYLNFSSVLVLKSSRVLCTPTYVSTPTSNNHLISSDYSPLTRKKNVGIAGGCLHLPGAHFRQKPGIPLQHLSHMRHAPRRVRHPPVIAAAQRYRRVWPAQTWPLVSASPSLPIRFALQCPPHPIAYSWFH